MPDDEWTRVTRLCPHCGARSRTLGTVCPECGKSYEPLGLLDRIPFLDDSLMPGLAARAWFFVFLAGAAVVVLIFVKNWQAGVVLLALLFVLLVAAIGISNWLSQR